MKILTWNLEWATLRSWRSRPILDRVETEAADVAVLTETQLEVAHAVYPHVVDAGPHPRSRKPNGSKVVVASRHPLTVVDLVGSPDLPERNFVAVDVEVPEVGALRVIGVVVRYNQKTEYIDALPDALDGLVTDRTMLAGDFNLPMLDGRPLERQLDRVLAAQSLRVQTASDWADLADELPLIDHIATAPAIRCRTVTVWPRRHGTYGRQLSDHAGATLAFSLEEQG